MKGASFMEQLALDFNSFVEEEQPSAKILNFPVEEEVSEEKNFFYNWQEPKLEKEIPHEYVVKALLHGSGFENGKIRIIKIVRDDKKTNKEKTDSIKNEYGIGGCGWCNRDEKGNRLLGLHGYDTIKSTKGMKLQWLDEEGEKIAYLPWKKVLEEFLMLEDYGLLEELYLGMTLEEAEKKAEERERRYEEHMEWIKAERELKKAKKELEKQRKSS